MSTLPPAAKRLPRLQVVAAWVFVGIGLLLTIAGLATSTGLLAVVGVLQLVCVVYALTANFEPRARDSWQTSSRPVLRARVANGVAILPSLALVFAAFVGDGPDTYRVSGEPAEVRGYTRRVVMQDGTGFTYICWKDEGRSSGACPAEETWSRLPRWSEPKHVEMSVDAQSHTIRSLVMDGAVIVDAREFAFGDYLERALLLMIVLGGGLSCVNELVWRRSRSQPYSHTPMALPRIARASVKRRRGA